MNPYLFLLILLAVIAYPTWKLANWFAYQVMGMYQKRVKNYYWVSFLALILILTIIF